MPFRTGTRATQQRVTRKTFASAALGVSDGRSITALKRYLHDATITSSPEEKLDLVMIEDYAHLADLLAEHGVPLAREHEMVPTELPRLVTLPKRRYILLLAACGVGGLDTLVSLAISLIG